MSKKNVKVIKKLARNSLNRALHYDFIALCEDIKSVYVSDDSIANVFYGAENGLIKGDLDSEYMEDYIPYPSKRFTNVFPGYTYIEHHKAKKQTKEFIFADKYTDWDSLNVDMSKYLALQGVCLFEVIAKVFKPKITANNYKISEEDIKKISDILTKAIDYQKQYIEDKFNKNEISKHYYDKYIEKYKYHRVAARILPDVWNKRLDDYKAPKHLKRAKNKLIKFFEKNKKMREKRQPENDYSIREGHSEL